MKQNILIATLLAAMLALAGCGGGSSSGPSVPPPPPKEPESVDLPDGATLTGIGLGLDKAGESQEITIEAGKKRNVGNVVFSCPEADGDCVATFKNELNSLVVMSTGGLTAALPDLTPIDITTGNNSQPTVSTDPLSNDVLVKTLMNGADNDTVWTTSSGNLRSIGTWMLTPLGDPKITLEIAGGAGAYWGHWLKTTIVKTLGSDDTEVKGERGTVFGGSTPYGKKPDSSLTKATYSTGSDDALFYYSTTGKADDWEKGMGNFSLTADFKTGMVGGNIGIANTVIMNSKVDGSQPTHENITLMPTAIDGSGTFSGTAKFANSDVTRQNGSWNGGFFGPTTTVTTVNSVRVEGHEAPSHAAGRFSVSRVEVGTSTDPDATQSALHIRGAFGGAKEQL